jgi:RNA polymerase sigma-70 factor, ECF subfamily
MPIQVQTCFSEAILTELPRLRAFARLMTNDLYEAEQEVEETVHRAMTVMDRMLGRPELRIQLLTVLRSFLIASESMRKDFEARKAAYEELKRPFRIGNEPAEGPLSLPSALLLLDYEDREAVVLSAGTRLSALEAAIISGCEVREHNARLCRGFTRLAELLPRKSVGATSVAEVPFSEMRWAREVQGMADASQF